MNNRNYIFYLLIAGLWTCNSSGPAKKKAAKKNQGAICVLLDSLYEMKSKWNSNEMYRAVSTLEKATGINSLIDCGTIGCMYDTSSYLLSDYVIWSVKLKCNSPYMSDSLRQRIIKERPAIVAERRKQVIPIELQ